MMMRGAIRSCDHTLIVRAELFADISSPLPVVAGLEPYSVVRTILTSGMILRGAFRSCDHPVITHTESFVNIRSPFPVVPDLEP